MQSNSIDNSAPVLANFWLLSCGEEHVDARQDIEISPHPDKVGAFLLEARLIASPDSLLKSASCEISKDQAQLITSEMAAIRSNSIHFTRHANPQRPANAEKPLLLTHVARVPTMQPAILAAQ